MLIAFRALQGAGAAIFPLPSGSSGTSSRPSKVGVAIGTMSSVFGIGGGVGLVLSGVIVEHLSWQWLFLIGALPVLISTVLIASFVPESPIKTPAKPDYNGAAALSVGFASLLLALSEGTEWGWTSPGVLALLGAAAVALSAGSRSSAASSDPLVDLQTLLRPGDGGDQRGDGPARLLDDGVLRARPGLPAVAPTGSASALSRRGAGSAPAPVQPGDDRRRPGGGRARHAPRARAAAADRPGARRVASRGSPPCTPSQWMFALWLPVMGVGMAFSLAAIGALVIDHCRPRRRASPAG